MIMLEHGQWLPQGWLRTLAGSLVPEYGGELLLGINYDKASSWGGQLGGGDGRSAACVRGRAGAGGRASVAAASNSSGGLPTRCRPPMPPLPLLTFKTPCPLARRRWWR